MVISYAQGFVTFASRIIGGKWKLPNLETDLRDDEDLTMLTWKILFRQAGRRREYLRERNACVRS